MIIDLLSGLYLAVAQPVSPHLMVTFSIYDDDLVQLHPIYSLIGKGVDEVVATSPIPVFACGQ